MADKTFNNVKINVDFNESATRSNITSGESINTLFGKIKKWFTDLKPIAFSGSYSDLTNKPTIPSVGNGTITIKQAGTTKGTFTTNQSGNTTIELTDNNTTYSVATQSANGLESAADKKKLDGIATGAEVNQNAFSNVVVGSTTIAADSKTDSLTLAGSNVTLTPDATNDKVTIGITKDNVTSALGYTPPTSNTNTTYSLSKSGSTITLTGSDGSTTSVTDSDTNTTYSNFVKSGSGAKAGLVPAPSTTAGTTKYLREDGTWSVPPDNNTTYSDMKGATSSAAGTHGLVPAPASGKQTSFLRGDGTWVIPTDTNTHYASGTIVNNSKTATTNTTSALTNGNVYLNHIENGSVKNSHKISGSGATTVTSDASGNIVISSTDTNTTYGTASTSAAGLMSASDKTKLNGIATNANNYSLPTATSSTLGGVRTTSSVTSVSGYTACPIINGVPYYKGSVTTTNGADPSIYRSNGIAFLGKTSNGSICWGTGSEASGDYSMALGVGVTSPGACSLSIGIYNKDHTSFGSLPSYSWIAGDEIRRNAFTIGNGTSPSNKSNAFRVTFYGNTYGFQAFNSSGADYAEYVCEWADGNTDNEDRVGYMVTIKDGKLYKANEGDYILGVTSGNPSVVGNADETYFWKYDRDDFNRVQYTYIPKLDELGQECVDEDGNVIMMKTMKVSDSYDPDAEYIPRYLRPEWDYVGMVGVIPLRDDGTCVADGYCKCGKDGVATIAEGKDFFTYYVKERISDGVISVII